MASRPPSFRRVEDVNVLWKAPLPTPRDVKSQLPQPEASAEFIRESRGAIERILDGEDNRFLLVAGPCSIHDVHSAMEYGERLKGLSEEVRDVILPVMRVYFEKPRTTVGWKGLLNDPDLNGSFNVPKGINLARQLLLHLAEIGLAAGTEALDTTFPQYIGDLISWTAIGARTTESQTHRELASGLSTPVGFKNGTDGQLHVAISAMKAARESHHFMGIDNDGLMSVFHAGGNRYGHVVLRGGRDRGNYDPLTIAECERRLIEAGLPVNVMVDCSHGNSGKNPHLQPLVAQSCLDQVMGGCRSIFGFMVESHLEQGRQELTGNRDNLRYGVSVTDACLGWADTRELVLRMADRLRERTSSGDYGRATA